MTATNWLVVKRSKTIIGGYRVVAFGLNEEQAKRRAGSYKTPHEAMPQPQLLKIRIAALAAAEEQA